MHIFLQTPVVVFKKSPPKKLRCLDSQICFQNLSFTLSILQNSLGKGDLQQSTVLTYCKRKAGFIPLTVIQRRLFCDTACVVSNYFAVLSTWAFSFSSMGPLPGMSCVSSGKIRYPESFQHLLKTLPTEEIWQTQNEKISSFSQLCNNW